MANARARWLRSNQTSAERHLWKWLRGLKTEGAHFRRQAPIDPYVLDFICHSKGLVVELDGGQHAEPDMVEKDSRRTRMV